MADIKHAGPDRPWGDMLRVNMLRVMDAARVVRPAGDLDELIAWCDTRVEVLLDAAGMLDAAGSSGERDDAAVLKRIRERLWQLKDLER